MLLVCVNTCVREPLTGLSRRISGAAIAACATASRGCLVRAQEWLNKIQDMQRLLILWLATCVGVCSSLAGGESWFLCADISGLRSSCFNFPTSGPFTAILPQSSHHLLVVGLSRPCRGGCAAELGLASPFPYPSLVLHQASGHLGIDVFVVSPKLPVHETTASIPLRGPNCTTQKSF